MDPAAAQSERRALRLQNGKLRAEIWRLEKLPATANAIRGIEEQIAAIDARIAAIDPAPAQP